MKRKVTLPEQIEVLCELFVKVAVKKPFVKPKISLIIPLELKFEYVSLAQWSTTGSFWFRLIYSIGGV